MKSTIVLFVTVFAILGLLLGYASALDVEQRALPEKIEHRDPMVQQRLFEACTNNARSDGDLTDEEYYRCAYSIYG
jgi:hypothetical protein